MNSIIVDREDAQRQYLEQRVVQAAVAEVYSEESAEGAHAPHAHNAVLAYLSSTLDPTLAVPPASPTTPLAAPARGAPSHPLSHAQPAGLAGRLEQSRQHLLGVEPGCLQRFAATAAANKACQTRLQQRVIDAVASSAANIRTFIQLSLGDDASNTDTDAVTRVREEVRRVREREAAITRLLLATVYTRATLAQEHVRVTNDLLAVLQLKTLQQHPLDGRQCKLLEASAALLQCKEDAVEQQIRAATYTRDTVLALQHTRKHLLARKAEVSLARDQARVRLEQLTSNPEILAVAREYNRTKEEIERLSGAFSRLKHHESASAHQSSHAARMHSDF